MPLDTNFPEISAFIIGFSFTVWTKMRTLLAQEGKGSAKKVRKQVTEKPFTTKWKKGDVGMAKRFSKRYGNKGWVSTTCNPMTRCLSAPDTTSLHHCLKCHHHLDPYLWNHTSFSCLFLRQRCRDVASGADRHLVIRLQVVEGHPLFPYFLEKR